MQMRSQHWMYNVDRRSQDFIDSVHYFLRMAEANKRDGFMCCPCVVCKNLMEYATSRTLHLHLFKSGLSGVIMEEGEEESFYHDDIIAEYGAFLNMAPS